MRRTACWWRWGVLACVCHLVFSLLSRHGTQAGTCLCRAMQVHIWRATHVHTCVAPTAMESRWVRWPCTRFRGQHTACGCNGWGRWSVFAMQESECYMCVIQVMGLENVKRVAARLADMLSGADSGRTSMGICIGTCSTAVTSGRLCSRQPHCYPLGQALFASCLAILRSLTTTTRRRTLLGSPTEHTCPLRAV